MSTRYQDLLDQASLAARVDANMNNIPVAEDPMTLRMRQAQEDRLDRLGKITAEPAPGSDPRSAFRAVIQRRQGPGTLPEGVERDMATLNPSELYLKYGAAADDMIAARMQANDAIGDAETAERGGVNIVADTGLDLTRSFTNIAGGLLSLGGTAVDGLLTTETAPAFAEATTKIDNYLKSKQSDALQGRREVTETYDQLLGEENARQYEADKEDSSTFVAGLRRIGRGAINAADTLGQDNMVLGSDLVNAGASMLAVGPIAKGVSAVAGRVAAPLAITKQGAVPAAIGLMEGGSGFTATMNEIMGMSEKQLMSSSQDYRELRELDLSHEEAKTEIAQDAARLASIGTGVVGGIAGKLVKGIEGNGVAGIARAGLTRAATREAAEEGIQGGAQPLMSNLAIAELADEDRAVSQDVGEGIGEGAVLGSMSSGILAAPGAAVSTTGKVAKGTAKLAWKGTLAGITAARETIAPLLKRGADAVVATATKAKDTASTTMSEGSIKNAFDIVKKNASITASTIVDAVGKVSDDVITPERKQAVTDYTSKLFGRTQVAPEEVQNPALHPDVQTGLAETTDRLEAVNRLAVMAKDEKLSDEARLSAATELQRMVEANERTLAEGTELYEAMDKAPDAAPVAGELKRLNKTMLAMGQTPLVKAAIASIGDMVAKIGKVANDTVPSPVQVANIVGAATVAPDKLDPNTVDTTLEHYEKGDIELTPEQVSTLSLARGLAKTAADYQERIKNLPKPRDRPTPNAVTEEIMVGSEDQNAPSAMESMKVIRDAVRTGDMDLAKAQMSQLVALGETLRNKVATLNEIYDDPKNDGTAATGRKYMNTTTAGKKRLSAEPLWLNPQVPMSVSLAQRVENDARAVTEIANYLAKEFKDLGFKAVEPAMLDAGLQGDLAEVNQRHRSANKRSKLGDREVAPKKVVDREITPTPTATPDTAPAPAPKPVVSRITAKQAASLSDVGLDARLGRLMDKRADNAATEEDMATFAVLDAEMSKRETEAQAQNEKDEAEAEAQAKAEPAEEKSEPTPKVEEKTEEPAAEKTWFGQLKGFFATTFKEPSELRSRLYDESSPIARVAEILKSDQILKGTMGNKRTKGVLTPEIADAYAGYLGQTGSIIKLMEGQLRTFLDQKLDGKTREQHIIDGTLPVSKTRVDKKTGEVLIEGREYDILLATNGKAANLLEEVDGKLVYNKALLEAAVLAAMQWQLVAGRYWNRPDRKAVAKILGIEQYQVTPQLMASVRSGMGATEVKLSMANMIQSFWGVDKSKSADMALVRGISESVASEILDALVTGKALKVVKVSSTDPDLDAQINDPKKDTNRYVPFQFDKENPLKAYPTAIEDAVLVEGQEDFFIGEPPAPSELATTQMNNRRADLKPKQMQAVRNESSTPYTVNQPLMGMFLDSLKEDLFIALFGESDLEKRVADGKLNKSHAATLLGRNATLLSAFQSMGDLVAQLDNLGDRAAPIFYKHGVAVSGRIQQLGRNTPQSSKPMREVVLPTNSTLDLSSRTTDDAAMYQLGLAQMMGIKVHNFMLFGRKGTIQQLNEKLTSLAPVIEFLTEWHKRNAKGEPIKMTAARVDKIKQAFKDAGVPMTPMAFHAVFDHARLQATPVADRKAFQTQVYIEADGATNGPFNAIMMATFGRFTTSFLQNAKKAGLYLTNPGESMNSFRQREGSQDLYDKVTEILPGQLRKLIQSFRGDPLIKSQMDAIFRLQRHFDPGNIRAMQAEALSPDYARGLAKNPMTITLYGSGIRGIAGNIVNDLMDKIYERMSEAANRQKEDSTLSMAEALFGEFATPDVSAEVMMSEFINTMNALTYDVVTINDGKVESVGPAMMRGVRRTEIDPQTYELTREEMKTMVTNLEWLFVKPLREAIELTVGEPVLESMGSIRDATNVQSVFMKNIFLEEIKKKLKELGRKSGEFLSINEQQEIFDSAVMRLAPFIETKDQRFYPAGSDRMTFENLQFSRSYSGRFRTNATFEGIDLAGVGGIPMMIIGMGDAYMMQLASVMADAVPKTLKIFDGINLSLDNARKGSRQINQAAFEASMNNPVRAVAESFKKFMSAVQVGDLSDVHKTELISALTNRQPKKINYTEPLLKTMMEQLLVKLEEQALSIDARHNVLRRVKGLSIDQMAAIGRPYVQENGDIDLAGMSDADATDVLNTEYEAEMVKLRGERAPEPVADTKFEKLLEAVSTVADDNVRVISHNGLKRLLVKLDIPAAQKTLLNEIVKSLSTKEYGVVVGSMQDIKTWTTKQGFQQPRTVAKSLKGYVSIRDRMVYVASGTSETLVHELIHAATYERLLAHYSGANMGETAAVQKEAIKRIEKLAQQFVELNNDGALPYEIREAYGHAREAMMLHQSKGTPEGRAAALNEFMAWALTNERLTDLLSKTEVKNPLVKLAKDVYAAIKQLIWGRRVAPKAGDDMLSNLQFNTGILINTAPAAIELVNASLLEHNAEFGANPMLSERERVFHQLITGMLNIRMDDRLSERERDEKYINERNTRLAEHTRALINARDVAQTFNDRGYPMDPQARGLFEMILTAMGTRAQLDANALSEIAKLHEHFIKVVDVRDFMREGAVDEAAERYYAQEKYDLLVGNFTPQKDLLGRTTMLSAFLALSMTNEDFRKVLSKFKPPQKHLAKWNTMDNVLDNIGMMGMESLSTMMSGAKSNSPDMQAAMIALEHRIIEVAQDRRNWIEGTLDRGHGLVDKGNEFLTGMLVGGSDRLISVLDGIQGKAPDSKIVKGMTESLKLLASLVNEPKSNAIQAGFMQEAMQIKLLKPLFDTINEIVGRTSENAAVYDMIKRVRAFVQQARQQLREYLPKTIARAFSRELTDQEWSNLHMSVGRSDASSFVTGGMTVTQAVDQLSRVNNLAADITAAETKAQGLSPRSWQRIQFKAKQLANFINTGQVGNNLLRNAEAVAMLLNEPGFVPNAVASNAQVKALDELISLYVLDGLPQPVKDSLEMLATDEKDGMEFMLSYMVRQREDEMKKVMRSSMARVNHYKGYLPAEPKGGHGLIVASDAQKDDLLSRGYTRVADYKGSRHERVRGTRGYYYSSVSGRGKFMQGIMQNVRPTAGGVDPITGYSNEVTTGGVITHPRVVERIARDSASMGHLGTEPLMPLFDLGGQVVAYERSVDPIQDLRIKRNTNLSEMIGAWHGRQIEEKAASAFNEQLVNTLGAMWAKDKSDPRRSKAYVNLFDANLDPVMKDAVMLLNREARGFISDQFPNGKFMVRKDMIDDVIGYRAASVGDMWTGISRWPEPMQKAFRQLAEAVFGKKAYERLMKAEKLWQNFIIDARVTIVIKSVIVPMANLAANFLQLLARGVPIHEIVKGMPKKTAEVKAYTDGRLRQIDIEAELRASTDPDKTRKLKAELQQIRDKNRYLTIWPLIEAGEFASISDAMVSREDLLLSEGRLSDLLESAVRRLPEGMRTAGRYAIIAKDTSLFKGLQRAVEYGDFLGKAVMYDHLTKRKGDTQEEALAKITEEFVNYDRLPGRARAALEANGLIWFWHFKLRAAKIGVSIIRNNPLHALLALMVPSLFGAEIPGSPVTDNAGAVLLDAQRSAYSIGMDQAFTSHLLHPTLSIVA